MMDAQLLVKKILAGREQWLALEPASGGAPAKRVCIRRPARWDALPFHRGTTVDAVLKCVVAWDGFTEADLLGPELAPDDPVPFDPALLDVVMRDRIEWVDAISTKLVEMVSAAFERKEATAKN